MKKRLIGVCAAALLSLGVAAPASAAPAPAPPYDILTMGEGPVLLGVVYADANFSGSRIEFRGNSCSKDKDGVPEYQFPLNSDWRWQISSLRFYAASQNCELWLRDRNGDKLSFGGITSVKWLGDWNDQTVTVQFT
ncbi:hypothetical protein ACFYVL_44075 [Streptomyces sp. NPDC004111]|uniref:hypothetical protein n=1 Tax=Streptomyces sp. NPDC004111 TaxID=3364690 RepID=UPI00367AAE22